MPTPLSVTYDLNSLTTEFAAAAKAAAHELSLATLKNQAMGMSLHGAAVNNHSKIVGILSEAAEKGFTKVISKMPLSDMAGSICGRVEDQFSNQYRAGKISFE
ncbi:MAG: hypothetical protein AUJ12_08365 [Alphaproteobacteria bacterium CG1_02_46_17]|nr:MAG: hypothetical protein AUJ12_08365 [Alphaproteobacteria bacterium CG1_02_46_17]